MAQSTRYKPYLNISAASYLSKVLLSFQCFVYFIISHTEDPQTCLSVLMTFAKDNKTRHEWYVADLLVQIVSHCGYLRHHLVIHQPESKTNTESHNHNSRLPEKIGHRSTAVFYQGVRHVVHTTYTGYRAHMIRTGRKSHRAHVDAWFRMIAGETTPLVVGET